MIIIIVRALDASFDKCPIDRYRALFLNGPLKRPLHPKDREAYDRRDDRPTVATDTNGIPSNAPISNEKRAMWHVYFIQPALRQEWSWMCLHGPQCAFEMSMFKCVLQFTL